MKHSIPLAHNQSFLNHKELDEPVDNRWLPDAIEKLDELGKLNANWDGHGAEAPNSLAIMEARKVLYDLEKIDFEPSRILPSAVGGVSLCFFKPKKYGEIECYNTGESIAIIKDTRTNWRSIWEVDSVAESVVKVRNYLLGFTTKYIFNALRPWSKT